MANVPWPPDLPYQPLKVALRFAPPKVKARTEMDDGTIRQRRRFSRGNRLLPHQWIWVADRFKLFEYWYEVELDQGTAWFDMLAWNGEAYAVAACRFDDVEGYSASQRGSEFTVTAKLEVDGYVVVSAEDAATRWPASFGD